MSLSIAIVGLPNVGKSTLFNALLKEQQALAANYPFATIEPNVGIVPVPDKRLAVLAGVVARTEKLAQLPPLKPATVEFVDVAGLVKGASEGEGLGNKFLSHIRETSAICHVVRAFADTDIIREGSVGPVEDLATIRTELQLADLATLEKQQPPKGTKDKLQQERWARIELFKMWLNDGVSINTKIDQSDEISIQVSKELCLLTAKPELVVVNVSENDLVTSVQELQAKYAALLEIAADRVIIICAKIESEIASLADEDQALYLSELGLESSGLDRLIGAAYKVLGLQSFLTAGEIEVRAWTITAGTSAPQAAGVIHTDFEKKFIKAKVVSFADFISLDGWKAAKEAGKVRLEGKEYIMEEGDIVEFMIGG